VGEEYRKKKKKIKRDRGRETGISWCLSHFCD